MKKKAILMPETLKIILAVLAIGVLIYLAVSVFGIFRQQYKFEQAKKTLNNIFEQVSSSIEKKDFSPKELLVVSPQDWTIISFPIIYSRGDNSQTFKPEKCLKEYCLCICPIDKSNFVITSGISSVIKGPDYLLTEISSICSSLGACIESDIPYVLYSSKRPEDNPVLGYFIQRIFSMSISPQGSSRINLIVPEDEGIIKKMEDSRLNTGIRVTPIF